MIRRLLCYLPLLWLFCWSAAAQGVLTGGESGPVSLEAENGVEWITAPDGRSGHYRARGAAHAVRGALSVYAQELTAFYREAADGAQQIYKLEAAGSVLLRNGDSAAHADFAVYDLENRNILLTGRQIALEQPGMTLTATKSLEFQEQKGVVIALGEAVLTQDDRRLRADRLTAYLEQEKAAKDRQTVRRVDAAGNVHLSTPTEIIRGAEGVYETAAERVTLCGDVKVTRNESQLNGECAEVDLKQGRSIIRGRVRSLILPGDDGN